MIEVVTEDGPEPETIIFLDRPEWEIKAKRAVLLGRPFLVRGKDLDLSELERLTAPEKLQCQLLSPDQALFWIREGKG